MVKRLFFIFLIFSALIFSYTPEKIEISSSASKVPKKRSQMRIDFTARAIYGFYENVSFYFASDNITTIEISPPNPIILDENGISGYGIINLDMQDTLYKVYLIIKSDEEILGSTYFYFRNEEGNALNLTEDQYLRFSEEKKQMWLNSQAEEHAKADLDALRAKGLQIAVEKWPKEGETFSPLQNNIGDTLEIMDNSLYEIKLTEKAIQDPAYKDIVKIELQPANEYPCYYANFTTNEEILFQPLCANLLADLKIIVDLKNPYSSGDPPWIENPIQARIEYRGYAYDDCTDSCKIKTFTKTITIERDPTNLQYGIAYALVNVPPSGYYVMKSIRLYTVNDKVRAGSCHSAQGPFDEPECWESHPEWTDGSENVYFWEVGDWSNDKMIRTVRCLAGSTIPQCQGFTEDVNNPMHLRRYVALVTAKNYSYDTDIKVEKIPLFDDLNKINNFWSGKGFENYYLDFRACPGDYSKAKFREECSATPIITIPYWDCFTGFQSSIYHETGHWLQYRMQRNWLKGGGGWDYCQETYYENAFAEGFAEWHSWYVPECIIDPDNCTDYEIDIGCGHNYDFIKYTHSKYPANKINILWDIFDSINDSVKDKICGDISLGCGDNIFLEANKLLYWIGHRYNTFLEFINGFSQPGMPLEGKEYDICKLLNAHGLIYPGLDCVPVP